MQGDRDGQGRVGGLQLVAEPGDLVLVDLAAAGNVSVQADDRQERRGLQGPVHVRLIHRVPVVLVEAGIDVRGGRAEVLHERGQRGDGRVVGVVAVVITGDRED